MKEKELREFRMHKDMLWSVIQSQAGTFDKAILELMMNAVDAGATDVRVAFDGKTFSVQDDGKGFASREEIESFFETFGTPHKEGDATFGKFRMGRGQVMAFTSNRWRSGMFAMEVDIKEKGLSYDLVTLTENAAGCRIEGELYDPMSPSDTIRTVDGLAAMCKYLPIPAYINGKRVSEDMAGIEWTLEDDDAYYLIKPEGRYLDVFNLGVLVRKYWGTQTHGVGGIVISKKQLEVNFARNDILVSKCEVWKRITAKLKQHAVVQEEKKPVQNEQYREMMLEKILLGAFEDSQEMVRVLDDAKVVTDYSGKHFSFMALARRADSIGHIVAPTSHSHQADRVHQKQLAVVLSPKFIERANGKSLQEILERIDSNLATFGGYAWTRDHLGRLPGMIRPLHEVAESISDQHDIVDEKTLTKEERMTLSVVNEMSASMAHDLSVARRNIRVCSSESVEGFTDGKTVIFIERKYLKVPGYAHAMFKHFDALKHLLAHEYAHERDSSTGHGHPAEFFEQYHDTTIDNLHGWTFNAVSRYISARKKAGHKMRSGDLQSLDLLTLETETV